MVQAGFTKAEFDLLSLAQGNSDGLVGLEVKAMNAVKSKFPDADDKYTITGKPDFDLTRKLEYSEEYHRFKSNIMKPLDKFYVALEARTGTAARTTEAHFMVADLVAIAGIVIMILIGGGTLWVIRSRVLRALLVLKSPMVSLSDNDLEVELSETNRADEIDEMAKSGFVFKDNMIEGKRLTAEQHESGRL